MFLTSRSCNKIVLYVPIGLTHRSLTCVPGLLLFIFFPQVSLQQPAISNRITIVWKTCNIVDLDHRIFKSRKFDETPLCPKRKKLWNASSYTWKVTFL